MEGLLLLREVPLFCTLHLEHLEAIQQRLEPRRFLAGEVLDEEGEPGRRLYLLVEGEVSVVRGYRTDDPIELGVQRPVSALGEMAVLDDQPRSATMVARTDTRVLQLEGVRLKELVMESPEIAFDFFRVLADRVRAADARFEASVRGNGAPA